MIRRHTQQRQAIRQAVLAADRPLRPQEILDAASADCPGIGLATIYRTVQVGVEEGWLQVVDLPGNAKLYEPAGKGHHHHFECRDCGKVYEVDGCPGKLGELTPPGFVLKSHELVLYGTCQACNA